MCRRNRHGVFAEARNGGIGILARVTTEDFQGRGLAGRFEGDVEVTGDIRSVNADCAEDFDVAEESVEAGTVMVLTEMVLCNQVIKNMTRKLQV